MVEPSLLIFETSIDVKPMIEPNFNIDWHLVSLGLTKQSFIVQQSRRGTMNEVGVPPSVNVVKCWNS